MPSGARAIICSMTRRMASMLWGVCSIMHSSALAEGTASHNADWTAVSALRSRSSSAWGACRLHDYYGMSVCLWARQGSQAVLVMACCTT